VDIIPHIVINKLWVKTSKVGIVDIFEDKGRGFALRSLSVSKMALLSKPNLGMVCSHSLCRKRFNANALSTRLTAFWSDIKYEGKQPGCVFT